MDKKKEANTRKEKKKKDIKACRVYMSIRNNDYEENYNKIKT